MNKFILKLRRKVIDFKCRVSERDIDVYIESHGRSPFRHIEQIAMGDSNNKPNRVAIKRLLQERKRRELYNNAIDRFMPDHEGHDGVPTQYEPKKSTFANFVEAYFSTLPESMLLKLINEAALSEINSIKPAVKYKPTIGKDDTVQDVYKDIMEHGHFHQIGHYTDKKKLGIVGRAIKNDKNFNKKVKPKALRVIDIIVNEPKKVNNKVIKKTKGR